MEDVQKSNSCQISDRTNNGVSRLTKHMLSYVQPRANKHKKESGWETETKTTLRTEVTLNFRYLESKAAAE